jgi:hypothetical protein
VPDVVRASQSVDRVDLTLQFSSAIFLLDLAIDTFFFFFFVCFFCVILAFELRRDSFGMRVLSHGRVNKSLFLWG